MQLGQTAAEAQPGFFNFSKTVIMAGCSCASCVAFLRNITYTHTVNGDKFPHILLQIF